MDDRELSQRLDRIEMYISELHKVLIEEFEEEDEKPKAKLKKDKE